MVANKLMPGWVAITDREGDTVHIAPDVTYHPTSDTPYQSPQRLAGSIIAVIQVQEEKNGN